MIERRPGEMDKITEFIKHIQKQLANLDIPEQKSTPGLTPAAILIPLYLDENIWKVLYIHRGRYGNLHRGEVAFPGGSVEPQDTDRIETALRETQEELGISPTDIQVLGKMPAYETVTGYIVTPIIGLLNWPVSITKSQMEVERVFSIPLDWLMKKDNASIQEFDIPGRGTISTLVYKIFDGEKLWGFSARITEQFINMIK
jgi:8-oxo-dGTP pyrophosphatase MutT (NUDIX family)